MTGPYITVRRGPEIIVGHMYPHFTSSGACICSCRECSRVITRIGDESHELCICPACPCTQDGAGGAP